MKKVSIFLPKACVERLFKVLLTYVRCVAEISIYWVCVSDPYSAVPTVTYHNILKPDVQRPRTAKGLIAPKPQG